MIIYFTDRKFNILGHTSTELPEGLTITEDLKTEDIETGVAVFECKIPYSTGTMEKAEACAEVGNYLLRSHNGETEFYTIIEQEKDTKHQEIYLYAEDAGLDLLNEIVGTYEADKAYPVTHYVDRFAKDSGFVIGTNEIKSLTRKLKWDGESTAAERLASVATQFDNAEISYSFDIKGLLITNKYINIYKKRGKDIGVQLRLNKEIDSIVTKKSIANLATSLLVTGGTPENSDKPITLKGYKYDDGDFYVSGDRLNSRKALEKWSRYVWNNEPNKINGYTGHIIRTFSYDTTSQKELCTRAVAELKKLCEIEVNYEVDITDLPDNVKIGDRVNIVDDEGGLYLSTRLLKLETSVADQEKKATLGEYLLKGSGIHQKVADLAKEFAENSLSAERALGLANKAKEQADAAKTEAESALQESGAAKEQAETAKQAADAAEQSSKVAQEAAQAAKDAVDVVEDSVTSLGETVTKAQEAADNAYIAAGTADKKAEEAKQSAANAEKDAEEAKIASGTAQSTAESAITKAEEASTTAGTAKTQAETASATAAAAKSDALKAQEGIDALKGNLTTLETTMKADYARKTELTEATANLETKIKQNAAGIESTSKKVQEIDETANNAAAQADLAQKTAADAQTKADAATADATKAQEAADSATAAAEAAQTNADNAKAAAEAAQNVATKAEEDLTAAQADLASVKGRVDATEEDIAAAEAKVAEAQAAADKAKEDATAAVTQATNAQSAADAAAEKATSAQETANTAASNAALAKKTADEAKGEAAAAQKKAEEAAGAATEAQNTALAAKENATAAQTAADTAVEKAKAAQAAAEAADSKAQSAATDLEAAKQNLADVTSKVDATQEEVAAAQAAVEAAQAAADKAKADAIAAQGTADKAKEDATAAQESASSAKAAADKAQADAEAAQAAADKAQADVDDLEIRTTTAETKIKQNSDAIELAATKEEVTQKLSGYYTKTETDAKIKVESDRITSTVEKVETVEDKVNNIKIGGRNLILNSAENVTNSDYLIHKYTMSEKMIEGVMYTLCIWGELGTGKTGFSAYLDGGDLILAKMTDNKDGTYSATFAGKTGTLETSEIHVYVPPETVSVPSTIAKAKLEKGNKATDWTPANEDVVTDDELTDVTEAINSDITTARTEIEQLSDSISMLVTDSDGSSLMEQTSDGWTFNIGAITDKLDDAKEKLEDVAGSVAGAEDTLQKLDSLVDDISKKTAYIVLATDDSGNPCIELGREGNPFKVRITNTSVDFMEGSEKIAYISNKALYIEKAIIKDELQIGENTGFVWKRRSNGNMGLRWVGDK